MTEEDDDWEAVWFHITTKGYGLLGRPDDAAEAENDTHALGDGIRADEEAQTAMLSLAADFVWETAHAGIKVAHLHDCFYQISCWGAIVREDKWLAYYQYQDPDEGQLGDEPPMPWPSESAAKAACAYHRVHKTWPERVLAPNDWLALNWQRRFGDQGD